MKNSNTEFELFTRHIYQKLVNDDVLKPTKVQHNVKLKGKSGCEHQIDVYWEYEIAGNKHRVAIECKNYNSKIPIGRVRDFFGALYDLGDVEGIMVTTNGYQKGAKLFADNYNIKLQVISLPNPDDIIGELVIKTHSNVRHRLFLIDEESASARNIDLQIYRNKLNFLQSGKWLNATHLPLETTNSIIQDSTGNRITSLDELEMRLPANSKPNSSQVFRFEDAWIETRYWGAVKIREVRYEFESEDLERTIQLAADLFVEAILKDAISGKTDYIPRY